MTFINVFEVAPEDVEAFTAGWRDLAAIMASAPGFRGAQLHRAVADDTRFQLVNVARWDDEQSWRAAATNPRMQDAARAAGSDPVAGRVVHNTGLYTPAVSFGPAG